MSREPYVLAEVMYHDIAEKKLDISPDAWILREYGGRCEHITEFGVWEGASTVCFLAAQPKIMHSYDIAPCKNENTIRLASGRTNWTFHLQDVREADIEPTELLFIDDLHTYAHLKWELEHFHKKVSNYIILHDTVTCGEKDQFMEKPGLMQAMKEFVHDHSGEWTLVLQSAAYHGLSVLKRISDGKKLDPREE